MSDAKQESKSKPKESNQSGIHPHDKDSLPEILCRQDLAYRGLSAVKLEYEVETKSTHDLGMASYGF